jgi:hypothetical protein
VTGNRAVKPGNLPLDPSPKLPGDLSGLLQISSLGDWSFPTWGVSAMGSAASKAQKGARRYPPSPSTLVNHPLSRPTQISNSFPLSGERSQHPEDVQAQLGGTT